MITLIGIVAVEYLEKYPNTSSLSLARILYRENPALYSSVDNARTVIRYYRGAAGKAHRESLANTKHVRKFIRYEQI